MRFMALGGTTAVGASCYYLELAGKKLLLDCGMGVDGKYTPAFDLLRKTELLFFSELDAILISHGHYDHVGALPSFCPWDQGVPVYATDMTAALMDTLLVDRLSYRRDISGQKKLLDSLQAETMVRNITTVHYGKSFQIGPVTVTFYPAGHVPGAAMIYLQSEEGNVLYTGDFKPEATGLTSGMLLPNTLRPDTVIICGLHARKPRHVVGNSLNQDRNVLEDAIRSGRPVHLQVTQLTKGLESAHWVAENFPDQKIYLDERTWKLGERLEETGMVAMRPQFYRKTSVHSTGITIGGQEAGKGVVTVPAKISLHASFQDCEKLLLEMSPETVFLVHAPLNKIYSAENDMLALHLRTRSHVITPEKGKVYSSSGRK